ncbi:hypothetical protein [Deinococcus multiflagellatus]|uniref:Uncharacterized protein n=1 Tax=Deinococcus multiflagellatus TaxID=1656887 RepID=A0ABW1ZF44_9DEIO
MSLVKTLERADLALVWAGPEQTERLTQGLKAGEVRLLARTEDGDEAVALAPASAREARDLGAALAGLARELKAASVKVPATPHGAALAQAALAEGWRERRYRQTPGTTPLCWWRA